MAIVRFSDEFKTDILRNAKLIFQKRIEEQSKQMPQLGDIIAPLVFDPVMPNFTGLVSNFISWTDDFELKSIAGTHYGILYPSKMKLPRPHSKVTLDSGVLLESGYRLNITLPGSPTFLPFKQQLDDWRAGGVALAEQRDTFVDGVKRVINAHSTLAPALKAWPPLWDLVSETYRERHRKVVDRAKSGNPEMDVDLDKLTATVVVNKLTK